MNLKQIPQFLTLIGLSLVMVGILFKLNHFMGAEQAFNAGAVILILGLASWGFAMLRKKG